VRYVDLMTGEEYEQPADIVVLASFTMSNTKYLLMSGIGQPYDPTNRSGVVGKNFCHQMMSGVNVFFKDRWINHFSLPGHLRRASTSSMKTTSTIRGSGSSAAGTSIRT